MENGIKIRTMIFNDILKIGQNGRNWEMLCSSDKQWVPFVGAGMSAWCYPTWNNLLKKIVSENYGEMEANIVEEALNRASKLQETTKMRDRNEVDKYDFYWMEEIAECIFNDNYDICKDGVETDPMNKMEDTEEKIILQRLRYYVGDTGVHDKRAAVRKLFNTFDVEKLHEGKRYRNINNTLVHFFKGFY